MQEEVSKRLVDKIEVERKKLEDISLDELSRPEVIARQQEFDKAVIEFMRRVISKRPTNIKCDDHVTK